ncbi:ATP-dependent DNA helicase [Neolewinella antarctica]|uniref:Energy-coupling factor transporter ATP-binding protein EcfA2 n=1 Tax=Neolewinella antarctica TaxID=442734 RepID=A0ABX0XDP7_9BACT|nr:AAA family ATPase [Neolewinella antarctica]NJC27028.1 energy-coupling factor transporter ATP-binding protein EcfA2 [Neolewinella antarctica]
MQIKDHFQDLTLTNDQQSALEQLEQFLKGKDRVFLLKGYAGSGKTTLLKGLSNYLEAANREVKLMAPTGRAANVINQKTSRQATTIHSGIYDYDRLVTDDEDKGDKEATGDFTYHFKLRNPTHAHDTIFIVDEASMVSDDPSQGEFFRFGSGKLLHDLFAYAQIQEPGKESKVIFVGDPAQLPPVSMNFSPALDANYLEDSYKLTVQHCELKEVKRQGGGGGILAAATKIRRSITAQAFNDFDLTANGKGILNPSYADFIATYNAAKGIKIIICHSNKLAKDINSQIRTDKFGGDGPIKKTDTVIIGANNHRLGVFNGEFALVKSASPDLETRRINFKKAKESVSVDLVWRTVVLATRGSDGQVRSFESPMLENFLNGDNDINPDIQRALLIDFEQRHKELKRKSPPYTEAIRNDPYFNCVKLKYGYAVTCHKAQGGDWNNAFVFWDYASHGNENLLTDEPGKSGRTNELFYRWAYTAITRASKKLYCINPPRFSSFSEMTFVDVGLQQAMAELTGVPTETIEISFSEVMPMLEEHQLQDAPVSIQDHFIERWHLLRQHYIDVVACERKGYEIWYTFEREDETAGFKYWVNGKDVFKPNFQKIPKLTSSDELFDEISKHFEIMAAVVVDRNSVEGILPQIEFDLATVEEKPFLQNLFDSLKRELNGEADIAKVEHFNHRERYTIQKGNASCTFDFVYNGKGFFSTVQPIEKLCNSIEILDKVKEVVENLKTAAHVI